MGFFSNLKNKARRQIAPVMPMAPQAPRPISEMPLTPEQMARKAEFERNKAIENERNVISKYGSRENMERMVRDSFARPKSRGLADLLTPTIFGQPIRRDMDFSQMPQISPKDMRNLQIPTEMPVMPEERMAPPVMNQMQGEPRRMMAVGGPLMGRAAAQAAKNKRIKAMADDIFGTDQQIMNIGRGQPGGLTYGARDLNRIRNAENAIMAGGGLGVAGVMDATNMFSEPASVDNISFMSPEAMGTDLANLRVGIDKVIDLARNKASEMGADINEYVGRTRSAYDQQMENRRMQELDAEQGIRPFSLLMGPDMPLFRPAERTVSDMDRESLDDILSDLEKKN